VEPSNYERFRDNQLFRGLDEPLVEQVIGSLVVERHPSDDVILLENTAGDSLYLIGAGSVRISKQGRGAQQETLTFLEAGEYFGEMAAFNLAPRSARATAVGEVVVGRLDRPVLDSLLRADPLPVVDNLARGLIERLRHTNEHFVTELLNAERLSLIGGMAGGIVHDLRNLITPARGYIQLMRNRATDPQMLRWIDRSDRSISQVLGMVQELLEFTRGTAPVLQPETIPVPDLLEELDEQYLGTLSSRITVDRRIEYDGTFVADRFRLLRVLLNILKNAVEAMPQGGTLRLEVALEREQVVFTIADTGVGIPEALLPRIFDPFVTHGKRNGTGLGMSISHSVVVAHGGRLEVESEVGVGTTLRIRLPRGG
jgi:signal transduction histidine kinase